MRKILIIEGIDRVGKDTLVRQLQRMQPDETWLHLHNGAPPDILMTPRDAIRWEIAQFSLAFETALTCGNNTANIAINRAHLSGYAYGSVFRGYRNMHKKTLMATEHYFNLGNTPSTYLLLLTIDPYVASTRSDDASAINTPAKAAAVQSLLKEAFAVSIIPHRLRLDVTRLSPSEVAVKVVNWMHQRKPPSGDIQCR